MLTNEVIANLQEKISLARLDSQTGVKIDVKVLSALLDKIASSKNVYEADLETYLNRMREGNKK